MAPYRTSRTSNRQVRNQVVDHDVFEGLPVRHWRKRPINVNTVPEKDALKTPSVIENGYQELPLPRDFTLLPENSQALLRAARMGLRSKPEVVDEDKEVEEQEPALGDEENGITMHKWVLVPRDHEGPEPEYLAKRRKGLPSVYSGAAANGGTGMRKTKVKKLDAEGNASIWEVLVPEGQMIDGEVPEDEADVKPAPAPGTVVEGVGVVNAEGLVVAGEQAARVSNRRKPPIPKKKKKHGPGRGRKKIIETALGQSGAAITNSNVPTNGNAEQAADSVAQRDAEGGHIKGEDSVMRDANDEDEEGSEEGSDEEGEDDREDGELSPTPEETPVAKMEPPREERTPREKDPTPPPAPSQPSEEIAPIFGESMMESEKLPIDMDVDENPQVASTSPPHQVFPDHTVDEAVTEAPNLEPVHADDGITSKESPEPIPPKESYVDTLPGPSIPGLGVRGGHVGLTPKPPQLEESVVPPPDVPQTIPLQTDPEPAVSETLQEAHSMAAALSPASPQPEPEPEPGFTIHQICESVPDIKSPPPIPLTLSRFPEPPSTLPPRPATPPPQRQPQPPPPIPLDQHRRPSGSTPQAPTPSPPTPVENTFENPYQGLSPKAPTMSPPTPIPADLDSSPETALADKAPKYQDPPPLSLDDPPRPPPQMAIPGLQSFMPPQQQRVDVQAAPAVPAPAYDAEIPHEHDPLDGLAAPEVPPEDRRIEEYQASTQIDVEAAPDVAEPKMDAEIPHRHDPLEGLKVPDMPPEERRLEGQQHGKVERDGVVRFEDGDEDLLGTHEREA